MDNEHFMEVNLLHKYGKAEMVFNTQVFTQPAFYFQFGGLFTLVGSSMNRRWKTLVRDISVAVQQTSQLNQDVRISPLAFYDQAEINIQNVLLSLRSAEN